MPRSAILKIGGSIAALLVALILVVRSFSGSAPGDETRLRPMIDSLTGEVFERYRLENGAVFPYKNPKTGENTLYPAEPCYWTSDGKAKLKPTFVYVKAYAGDPGKTFCPECGREVRRHNPMPPDALMLEALEREKGGK